MVARRSYLRLGGKFVGRRVVLVSLLIFFLSGCQVKFTTFSIAAPYNHALRAEELRREGKCEEAIGEYLAHVQARLAAVGRDQSENPYFYYLLIGDCHLQLGKVAAAKADYVRARDEGVERALVAERLRRLGHWYEAQGKFVEGIEILQEFRSLDPLMFDLDIDRLHKLQVQREEENAHSDTP